LDTLEFAQIEKQFVDGLRQGKDALVSLQKEMGSLDDIEKLMDDSREAMEYQQVFVTFVPASHFSRKYRGSSVKALQTRTKEMSRKNWRVLRQNCLKAACQRLPNNHYQKSKKNQKKNKSKKVCCIFTLS
jgi:hypothetical protein